MAEQVPRVAILASGDRQSGGGGSTAERVARDALEGKVRFSIRVVICNNSQEEVPGLYKKFDDINTDFGLTSGDAIDVVQIGPQTHPKGKQGRGQTWAESAAICKQLENRQIDFVAALGYLRIISKTLVSQWAWHPAYGQSDPQHNGVYHPKARILNNHPAILPFTADTHGHGAHQRAVDLFSEGRLTHTAMTYHLVSSGVDSGPVVFAEPIRIQEDDDANALGSRVQAKEKELTAQVLERHLTLREEHIRGNS